MKTLLIPALLAGSIFALSLSSCYYDNMEEMFPKDTTQVESCDTTGSMTYATNIDPIMQNYCTSCHSGGAPSGGVSLDNYDDVKAAAASGKLYSAVTWDGNTSQMPKGSSSKIDNCEILKIWKWIGDNYPQ